MRKSDLIKAWIEYTGGNGNEAKVEQKVCCYDILGWLNKLDSSLESIQIQDSFENGMNLAIEIVRQYEIEGNLFHGDKLVTRNSIKHIIKNMENVKFKSRP
jgi:hypothetical protein